MAILTMAILSMAAYFVEEACGAMQLVVEGGVLQRDGSEVIDPAFEGKHVSE